MAHGDVQLLMERALDAFTTVEKYNFGAYGLQSVFSLKSVTVNWNLLCAAANFWDPNYHVFRFGSVTLCPTHEDYCNIMGISTLGPMIRLPSKSKFTKELSKGLGVKPKKARRFTDHGLLNMRRLLEVHQTPEQENPGDFAPEPHRKARDFTLCMGVLSTYFLVSFRMGHQLPSFFADIAGQLKNKVNPVPTILAETFEGLSNENAPGGAGFRGSPHLLYLWLCIRLRIAEFPQIKESKWEKFTRKETLVDFASIEDWKDWLSNLTTQDVNWDRLGSRMDEGIVLASNGSDHVMLTGLLNTSFYCPRIIPRQIGFPSWIPMLPRNRHPIKELTVHLVEHIATAGTIGYLLNQKINKYSRGRREK